MKSTRIPAPGTLLLVVSLLVSVILLAAAPALAHVPPGSPQATQVQPGNYCVGCHTPGDERLANVMAWNGSINREVVSGCVAASRVHEEVYYTQRMLLAIDRARADVAGRVDVTKLDAQVAAGRQTYSRLLDTPITSLDAVSSEAQILRYQLGKRYTWLNQARVALKQQRVLLAAGLLTLALLISLSWGLRNTIRFSTARISPPPPQPSPYKGEGANTIRFGAVRRSSPGTGSGWLRLSFKVVLFVALVFALFSLPIFRIPLQQVASATEEEQARQAALDTASRIATTADRALARAWMLARVGAAWEGLSSQQAENALDTALAAANEAQINDFALWGQAQAVREGTVGSQVAREKAELMADRLNATNSRAWALRLIAAEWYAVDRARAEKILEQALVVAQSNTGIYRDLDMRSIAVTWAGTDSARGLAVAGQVRDPGLRAWGLWEIAAITGDEAVYDQAAQAARQVTDPVARARSLREVAVHSDRPSLFQEALTTLDGVQGAPRAYALSDLATASGDASIIARIDPAYPDARAAALYRLGQFKEGWIVAGKIADPFDRARAQAAIAGAWGNVDAARQIADPTLRDRALYEVAVARKDVALAQGIESPYYRVRALTTLGQYQAALAEADNLGDTYPLRALAIALAEHDAEAALALVDKMDREADKADALRAIAAATGDPDTFDKALAMALAARVRGDALAPVEASLALAQTFQAIDESKAEAAFAQAYEIAQTIMVKY
jgi:hypothetical protein